MRVFLDACIIIYWVEASPIFYAELIAQFERIANLHPQHKLTISRLSLLECLVQPLRQKNQATITLYQQFFENPSLSIIEMDIKVIDLATTLRATYGIRTPDAIQVASCLSQQGEHLFLTNDKQLEKIPELQVTLL